jgi:alpha-mannosidase
VLRDYLPRVDGRFYYELHDGIFTVVPTHLAEKAAREIKYLFSNLPYKQAWGRTFPVEFPVDAKMGPSWGELKEVI